MIRGIVFAAVIVIGIIGAMVGGNAIEHWEKTPSHTDSSATIEIGEGGGVTAVATMNAKTLTTGNDRLDKAWQAVSDYYYIESLRVTAIHIADAAIYNGHPVGGIAWVSVEKPTEIYILKALVQDAAMSTLEETLAHELTHVTQNFDKTPADYDAQQREATLRGSYFKLLRKQQKMGDWTWE